MTVANEGGLRDPTLRLIAANDEWVGEKVRGGARGRVGGGRREYVGGWEFSGTGYVPQETLGFTLVDIQYRSCHVESIIADNSGVENK